VLTEEEGALLNKGREGEAAGQAKALKKASKLSVSDAIDNAKIYGDIRARYERRDGDASSTGVNTDSNRARYKITLGVETKAGDWYSDLAMAMGKGGRSDNVSFGDGGVGADAGMSTKDSAILYLKRATLGWNVTPWLAVEAGRMKNPLYMVNAMVFDHDIVTEGLQEKLNYKLGETNLFANFGQWVYSGKEVASSNGGTTTTARQNMLLAFQAGAEQAFIADKLSAKGAIGYYSYTGNPVGQGLANFAPTLASATIITGASTATVAGTQATNNLNILDIPFELDYMITPSIGVKPYAEYAVNTSGSDRYNAACAAAPTVCGLGNDDSAWLVGLTVGSAKDLKSFMAKKMAKGDWSANLWYQSVGAYALDPNAVDSDIMDGRLNMEGTTLKAQYNVEDNVALNFTGAWGDRKNNNYAGFGPKVDISGPISKYNLYQFDVTYKF